MSGTTRAVATKEELKKALQEGVDNIYVVDQELMGYIRTIKSTKKGVVIAAAAAAGVVAIGSWNPLGRAVGAIASGAALSSNTASVLIAAIAALTVLGTVFIVMVNDYEIESDGAIENKLGGGDGKQSPKSTQKTAGNFSFKLKKAQKA